jgi:hypothetical protein
VRVFQLEKTTFIYWPIEHNPKAWFVRVFQLERITFIYCPTECTTTTCFFQSVVIWKNYLHLLTNWMHFKSLIC